MRLVENQGFGLTVVFVPKKDVILHEQMRTTEHDEKLIMGVTHCLS